MDEEFIFQVTEEELAQFPEEGNQSEEEQNQQEYKQELEIKDKAIQESTEKKNQRGQQGKDTFIIRPKTTQTICYQQKWQMEQGPKCREEEKKQKQQKKGMPIQCPTQK